MYFPGKFPAVLPQFLRQEAQARQNVRCRLCPQQAVLIPVLFSRPAPQKAEHGAGPGAGTCAVQGLLLHLPGRSG